MGGVCATGEKTEAEENAKKRAKQIDGMLKKERRATEAVKLLLLGTGDSGKSTFLKQMKIIHKEGFSAAEMLKYAKVLQENCLYSMQKILQCEEVKVGKNVKEARDLVLKAEITEFTSVLNEIKLLWQEKAVQEGFDKRSELHIPIPSLANYYFENVDRFAQENFKPSTEDMLRARLRTTGIQEVVFEFSKTEFTLVDVGGQRSERRKWLHCFNDVTSVIFLTALDEYDLPLEEDYSTNRFEESLRLFGEVSGNFFDQTTSWILFLNKCDLFETKIKKLPLNMFFDDFPEENAASYDESVKYLQQRYQANFKGGRLYTFVTCAIDTANCKNVFAAVRDSLFHGAMQGIGF
jgi:GTPase SAR1 family protein